MSEKPRNGRIVTFYSYKGGTGRSMAVANVAWILASTGRHVLVIDWDLEAPGLHRYLHPFIGADKELSSTEGLIDFFVDFATTARLAYSNSAGDDWYKESASLVRYATPIDWPFGEGSLEFVPAGRQDSGYAVRVMSFNWPEFYDKLGGGVFLEALKGRLRHDYDFVLIDSRTGISDTAGICTVQMPDELVVLFTLNQQSMKGAAAVAEAADQQRRKPSGEPGLRIWPVPTRVELAEKDRLESAREECRARFERYIGHLPRKDRSAYWGDMEVLYQPYYAYEEVLATFADKPLHRSSMLTAMEHIASVLTRESTSLTEMTESERQSGLARFERPKREAATAAVERPIIFVSYSAKDQRTVEKIVETLTASGFQLWWDRANVPLGARFEPAIDEALTRSAAVLLCIGPGPLSEWREHEISTALELDKRVVPVLINGATYEDLPPNLRRVRAATLPRKVSAKSIAGLANELRQLLSIEAEKASLPIDPQDPQKGRWGGKSSYEGRELSASVRSISTDYFEVTMEVGSTTGKPLTGEVVFHLHPTFPKPVQSVQAAGGHATLTVLCWGAFTVGAVADDGRTNLELDLASLPSAPPVFRER